MISRSGYRPHQRFRTTGTLHFSCALCLLLFFSLLVRPAIARQINDMSGATITLPDHINRVVGVSPPCTYLLYAIDPTLIAGLNFPPSEDEQRYLPESFTGLPVIGGFFGQGRTINREVLLGVHPDLLLIWAWKNPATTRKYAKIMKQLDFPQVSVKLDSIKDYPAAIRFLGAVVDRRERGEELGEYASEALNETGQIVSFIPDKGRVRVYYAEGVDGLSTEQRGSMHSELIPLAGGINVHESGLTSQFGMEKVSMEQVLLYAPEVILVKEKLFYSKIFSDPRWQNIPAVRNHRVYLIPDALFNWFDRPPSFMRLLGCKWLLHVLHPERYEIDLVAETIRFYRLFLGIVLTPEETRNIINL